MVSIRPESAGEGAASVLLQDGGRGDTVRDGVQCISKGCTRGGIAVDRRSQQVYRYTIGIVDLDFKTCVWLVATPLHGKIGGVVEDPFVGLAMDCAFFCVNYSAPPRVALALILLHFTGTRIAVISAASMLDKALRLFPPPPILLLLASRSPCSFFILLLLVSF